MDKYKKRLRNELHKERKDDKTRGKIMHTRKENKGENSRIWKKNMGKKAAYRKILYDLEIFKERKNER